MEQLTTRIGIEPGLGLVGRFGDTVILIPRDQAAADPDKTTSELLGLAAEVGSDRHAPAGTIASRLAAWVIGHMSGEAPAFGIVAPMRDGVVMFLRGAVLRFTVHFRRERRFSRWAISIAAKAQSAPFSCVRARACSSVSVVVSCSVAGSDRPAGRHRLPGAAAQRRPAFVTGRLRS